MAIYNRKEEITLVNESVEDGYFPALKSKYEAHHTSTNLAVYVM